MGALFSCLCVASGIALLLVLTATSQKLSLPSAPFEEEALEG